MTFGLTMTVACGNEGEEGGENGGTNEGPAEPDLVDENFDAASMPSTWTLIDADGDGINWAIFPEYGIDGGNCIMSGSYDNNIGVLTPDNYIVSPEMHVHSTGGYTLTWYVAAQDPNYPADFYTVYAGTLENGVFTPKATLYSETLSSANFAQRSVSLDELKGQDVRIAFRHHNSEEQYIMKIDNVKVAKAGAKGPATYAAVKGMSRN